MGLIDDVQEGLDIMRNAIDNAQYYGVDTANFVKSRANYAGSEAQARDRRATNSVKNKSSKILKRYIALWILIFVATVAFCIFY